jgi:hypothetical protein
VHDQPQDPASDEAESDDPASADEADARAARARRLREEIADLGDPASDSVRPPEPESPREFIERRMNELESEDEVESETD